MAQVSEQNLTEWQPDIRQIKMVEFLVDPDDKRSKREKIADIGVSPTTFYEWMKDKRFVDYMNSQLTKYTDGELSEVWKALMRKCKMGDISAIKLFFEMKGMYSEKKKVELAGAGGGPMELLVSVDYGDGDSETE